MYALLLGLVLQGDPTKKRLVFFGTSTTLGLKAGFSGDGYPDSLTFGYKRKEFSFIPRLTFQGERLRPAAQSVRVYGRGAGRSPLHRQVSRRVKFAVV